MTTTQTERPEGDGWHPSLFGDSWYRYHKGEAANLKEVWFPAVVSTRGTVLFPAFTITELDKT